MKVNRPKKCKYVLKYCYISLISTDRWINVSAKWNFSVSFLQLPSNISHLDFCSVTLRKGQNKIKSMTIRLKDKGSTVTLKLWIFLTGRTLNIDSSCRELWSCPPLLPSFSSLNSADNDHRQARLLTPPDYVLVWVPSKSQRNGHFRCCWWQIVGAN